MLRRGLRLGGRGAFEAVFRTRKAISGAEISLFFAPSANQETRVGFAFKQKSFPKSATRHFLKRKGSAIMEELHPLLPKALDVVVLFHRPFSGPVDYQSLKSTLENLIKRLK